MAARLGRLLLFLLFSNAFLRAELNAVPMIKPWKKVPIPAEYAGAWIVVGDLDNDGTAEIVSARNFNQNDEHYTTSVIALDLEGKVLWTWGDAKAGRNACHHDVACQIYDWDGDGNVEVVVATIDEIVSLDGKTGRIVHRFPIQKNAADCLVFANLTGKDRPADVLVKTRYSQIWAYNPEGQLLWSVEKPAGYPTAHQPRPIDLDLDGRDEVMAGFAMLDSDGTERWSLLDKDLPLQGGHLDCARILKRGKTSAETTLVLSHCGANALSVVTGDGEVIWSKSGEHFESIDVGKVRDDLEGNQIIVDLDHRGWGNGLLWILSDEGELLGEIESDWSRHHSLIQWGEGQLQSIFVAQARGLFDGYGRKLAEFELVDLPKETALTCLVSDVDGNGTEDLVVASNPASTVFLFRNPRKSSGGPPAKLEINHTFY